MRFWVAITDRDWFTQLAALQPEDVNFWQPSQGHPAANILQAGVPFLFKLRRSNWIAGGGVFVRFTSLPAGVAWSVFGASNGAQSEKELLGRLGKLARGTVTAGTPIGCSILTQPCFLPENESIEVPDSWHRNIQQGKSFETGERDGDRLWARFSEALQRQRAALVEEVSANEPRFGYAYLARSRLGQGAFQVLVLDAYGRRCAVSGERTLPVLDAAHIRAHDAEGPNRVDNGLLLRTDIHRLFDRGYATLDHDYRFVVSRRVNEEFSNGREYYRHHGKELVALPERPADRPSPQFLEWHRSTVFRD